MFYRNTRQNSASLWSLMHDCYLNFAERCCEFLYFQVHTVDVIPVLTFHLVIWFADSFINGVNFVLNLVDFCLLLVQSCSEKILESSVLKYGYWEDWEEAWKIFVFLCQLATYKYKVMREVFGVQYECLILNYLAIISECLASNSFAALLPRLKRACWRAYHKWIYMCWLMIMFDWEGLGIPVKNCGVRML